MNRTPLDDLVIGTLPGGFDPARMPVWLWSQDGTRVLWASRGALVLSGARDLATLQGQVFGPSMPAAGRLAELGRDLGLQAPPRLERLRFHFGARSEFLTCLVKRVTLVAGGSASLVAAFGLRTMPADAADEAGSESAPQPISAPDLPASEAAPPASPAEPAVRLVADDEEARPVAFGRRRPPLPRPGWLDTDPAQRRPIRFTWSCGVSGRIDSLSPSFGEATGLDPATMLDRDWTEVLENCDLDGKEQLASFLSATQTWSGAKVDWHMPGLDGAVPVELSGVPVFDLDRNFSGFRGFGVVRGDLATVRPQQPAETETRPVASPAVQAAEDITVLEGEIIAPGQATVEAPAPAEDIVFDDAIRLYGDELPAPEPLDGDRFEPAPDMETSGTHLPAADISDAAAEQPPAASIEEPVEELPTDPRPEPAPAEQNRLPVDGPAATAPAPAEPVPLQRLRTVVGAQLGGPKVVPLRVGMPSVRPEETPSLSSAERNAFREIARALGARLPDEAAPAATDLPEPPALSAVGPAEPGPESPVTQEPTPQVSPQQVSSQQVSSQHVFPPQVSAPQVSAPQAVAPQAEPLLRFLERMPYGLLVQRGDVVLAANRALLDMTGYADAAELTREGGVGRLFQGRTDEAGRSSSVLVSRRDGTSFPAAVHVQVLEWADGPATAMMVRRAEEIERAPGRESLEIELRTRQGEVREARAILETATDGVLTLDGRGRILGMNRSAEALFGYDQNEVAGDRFTLLLSPESHASAVDYLEGLKGNGVATVLNDGREVMGRERKGGRIPLFMTIGRVSGDGDEPKFAAVLRDITNWKRAEAELTDAKRQADRASAQKSDFLAKISHEIRTPLNAIIGFAEVMKDEQLGPIGNERYKEYLNDILVSGQHVMSLVNDLLDLSKVEAGRMELSFTSVDLNEIVGGCIAIMQPQANRDRVIMRSHLAPRLPRVVADERSVRQIVLNLLSNAAKFTDAGGQVIVSTALTERGEAVIRVRDTGVGMSEKDIETALEPFRRVQTAHPRGGTGLGLPLTKALAEANRASLNIRSKPLEGTLVEITFPPTRVLAE